MRAILAILRATGAVVLCLSAAALALAPSAARADERVIVPLYDRAPTADSGACFRVQMSHGTCSGTCIATDGKRSLVLAADHCFSEHHLGWVDAQTTAYPQTVRIVSMDGKSSYSARAVVGAQAYDMGLIVVEGVLPVATIDLSPVRVGDDVRHWGVTSGPAAGKVLAPRGTSPTAEFRSSISSIPGDSGCGIFRGGKLVAMNWGYWVSDKTQGGTPIKYAVALWKSNEDLRKAFTPPVDGAPELPPVELPPVELPPAPPVVIPAPPVYVCPPCPPCRERRPILFPRLRGYR